MAQCCCRQYTEHPPTPKMRALQVYDFIEICAVILENTLLSIYKQAQELGTVDEFCNTEAKLFFLSVTINF